MLELGVCYYPEQWERSQWRKDAESMAALGLDWVRIGEFSWSLIERAEGQFDWDWLDEIIDVLGSKNLKVMLCTPTAAPPKWLVDSYPEVLPVDIEGRVKKFGSRRHYCFSSKTYLEKACGITNEFARRYCENHHVKAWQIDNEYGDHDTIRSYSESATVGFREWLSERYGSIDALNAIWGTSFWSMRYGSFQEIELPNGTVAEPNPTHEMDFAIYSSDMVAKFNKSQCEALRKHVKNVPISHNFMANSFDFDHFKVASDLDFVSWDSYPLGNLIQCSLKEEQKDRWFRTGDPDYQGFYSDLYRFLGKGNVWIAEQQPGPVNWASNNQSPDDGMVRFWTWMAYAHGVNVVCYFRWRQAPFAQEQFHSAIQLPDGTPDQAYFEIKKISQEKQNLPVTHRNRAKVAMIIDYPSRWAQLILPQSDGYCGHDVAFSWYRACRELGVDVDFVNSESDFTEYNLVLIPDSMIVSKECANRLRQSKTKTLVGPRVGSKTESLHIPDNLPPGPMQVLLELRVVRVESLPKWHKELFKFKGNTYPVKIWRECVETSESVIGKFIGSYRDGWPAIVESNQCRYLCTLSDEVFVKDIIRSTLKWAEVENEQIDADIRITFRGNLGFAFNFGKSKVELPNANRSFLIGNSTVQPLDMAVWQEIT